MKLSPFIFIGILFISLQQVISTEVDNQLESSKLECRFCKNVLEEAVKKLSKDSTVPELKKMIKKGCKLAIVDSWEKKCNKLGKLLDFFDGRVDFLLERESYTPHHMCQMVDFCSLDCCVAKTPEQVHIALSGDSISSMTITWVTKEDSESVVKYGTKSNNLNQVTSGSDWTDNSGGWKGHFHKVTLVKLQPDTVYYYQAGGKQSGFSQTFSFRTFPSKSDSVRFGVIGDMGVDPQAEQTVKILTERVQKNSFEVLVHVGDISYSDGYQGRWDQYFRFVEPIVANVPYMVCPGNHEIGPWNYIGLDGYKQRFLMPNKESGTKDNTYYSWNYGPVHWVSINSESQNNSPLVPDHIIDWVKKDLDQAKTHSERKLRPWIVVYLHRPMYCANDDDSCHKDGAYLRDKLEQIFFISNVSIVITGHKHDYERTAPLYKGRIYPDGQAPIYFVNGAAGNRENSSKFKGEIPEWSLSRSREWGYTIMEANKTHLKWDFRLSKDDSLFDTITLKK